MRTTDDIGQHISSVIDGLRDQAQDAWNRAQFIDDAWVESDIDELLRLGAITPEMAKEWWEERECLYASEGEGNGDWPMTVESADILLAELKRQINAPYVGGYKSTLGGAHRVSLLLVVSLDPRETWQNGILENSRYTKLSIYVDGTIEDISGHGMTRFRKSRAKSFDDVINKINKWIDKQPR